MNTNQVSPARDSRPAADAATQAQRMRAAIDATVKVGPAFLRGEVDADHMAHAMVHAVRDYAEHERAAGGDGAAHDRQSRELQQVLAEIVGCGSGYLAGRCDAACVARTITQLVQEFGSRPAQH